MSDTPHDMDECIQCGHTYSRHVADQCCAHVGTARERKDHTARLCTCPVLTALFIRKNPASR